MNGIRTHDAVALVAKVMSANAPKSYHCGPLASVRSLAAESPGALSHTSSTRITSTTAMCFYRRSTGRVLRFTRCLASLALSKALVIGRCRAAMVWCLQRHNNPPWSHFCMAPVPLPSMLHWPGHISF